MESVNPVSRTSIASIVALIGVSLIGSIMGIFARELAVELNVVEQVALRSMMGAIVLLIVCWRFIDFKKFYQAPMSDIRLTIFRAISMFVIALSLGTIAFVNGNYASVAVIMAFPTPAILAVVMLGERISLKETLLVSVAFIGAAITIFGGTGQTVKFEWPLICAFAATVFISYSILARKRQTPLLNNYETTLLMLVTAAVAMTILSGCWIVWSQHVPHVSGRTVWVALLAGLANIGFLLLSNFAIPNLKGVVTNNVLSLQPLFGAIVGFTVFHERPTSLSLLGGSIILISVILIANPAFLKPNSEAKSGI